MVLYLSVAMALSLSSSTGSHELESKQEQESKPTSYPSAPRQSAEDSGFFRLAGTIARRQPAEIAEWRR
jgi:hypothetical protein